MNFRSLLIFVVAAVIAEPSLAQTPCMFNPSTSSYQQCHHVTAGGQCAHYGTACGNSGQGMYNPKTNANQACAHVTADGKCAHYGAPSRESGQCMFNRAAGAYQTCLHVTAGGQCVHLAHRATNQHDNF